MSPEETAEVISVVDEFVAAKLALREDAGVRAHDRVQGARVALEDLIRTLYDRRVGRLECAKRRKAGA